jgi:SAM-dependent methyltransferase
MDNRSDVPSHTTMAEIENSAAAPLRAMDDRDGDQPLDRAGTDGLIQVLSTARQNLPFVLRVKYGAPEQMGPAPRLRQRFGYSSPDDWYEAAVFGLVSGTTTWLDVGCGRNVFPSNRAAAKLLSERCRLLVGLDPSDNIRANDMVHEHVQSPLADYVTDRRFDLLTLRMVAEHITDPVAAVGALARLTAAGGRVVVYTVNKWAPATMVSAITPFWLHVAAKRVLWQTDERDTFPTAYRMNTRGQLKRLFAAGGFQEESFQYLDDCQSFGRFGLLSRLELLAWKGLRSIGLRYPESCILAVFRKSG